MEPNPVLSETSQMSRKRQRNQASGASAPLIIPVRKKGEAIERKTTAIPKSNLLPRLKNFLERMKTANEELEADIEKHGKGKFEIDFVDAKQPQEEDINEANSDDVSNQAPMIEMNLRVVLGEEDTKLESVKTSEDGNAGREQSVNREVKERLQDFITDIAQIHLNNHLSLTDQTLGLVPRKDKSGRPLVELLPEDQN